MWGVISNVADRWASEQFEERYARVLKAMSLDQAKAILGFPPRSNPTKDEIQRAYRIKAIENHPDRGGDPQKMVEINVAKDILEGKARPSNGDSAAGRPPSGWRPEDKVEKKPKTYVDVIKGKPFSMPSYLMGGDTEIKFISKTLYGTLPPNIGHYMWAIYARNEKQGIHIFVGIRHRRETEFYDPKAGGLVKVEESWDYQQDKYPISRDLLKLAPSAIKNVLSWADGLEPWKSGKIKYLQWQGDKLTESALLKMTKGSWGGGAALKDVLIGLGLVGDAAAAGRKTNVEVYYRENKEKRMKVRDLKLQGKLRPGEYLLQYDWFVRVNGKEYELKEKTVENLIRNHFLGTIVSDHDLGEGVPKNISMMRGSRFRADALYALEKLSDGLANEPSSLVVSILKAIEDLEDAKSKKAAIRHLVAHTSIREAAELCGVAPYEILRAWE